MILCVFVMYVALLVRMYYFQKFLFHDSCTRISLIFFSNKFVSDEPVGNEVSQPV
jgi:hypothetical protein